MGNTCAKASTTQDTANPEQGPQSPVKQTSQEPVTTSAATAEQATAAPSNDNNSNSADDVAAKVEAIRASNPENRMAKHFDVEYYKGLGDDEKKGLVQCCRSGLENPDSSMGCYAMQPADYDRFKPFFSKVIADYHGVSVDAKHMNNWDLDSVEGLPEGGKLDLEALGLPALSMRVRVGRNLADFPLPGAMTQEDRVKLESKVCDVCDVCDECDECDECVFWERGGERASSGGNGMGRMRGNREREREKGWGGCEKEGRREGGGGGREGEKGKREKRVRFHGYGAWCVVCCLVGIKAQSRR